jgi:hypothetical protein
MLANKLLGAAAAAVPQYIEDVFSTYLYTGTGAAQTITNGIDLSTYGGLLISKSRSTTGVMTWVSDATGLNQALESNTTGTPISVTAFNFNSNGYGLNTTNARWNTNGTTYASWTFREQAKFFDVVTYTGNGSNRTIAHNLGSTPGFLIVKRTDSANEWYCYHRAFTADNVIYLNLNNATALRTDIWNSTAPTSTVFSLGTNVGVNANGGSYVAYLFAHDAGGFGSAGTDNVITCGSYTGNGSATGPTVTLGYEPQWVMIKKSSAAGTNWEIIDSMRGFTVGSAGDSSLRANLSAAEITATEYISPTATGFNVTTTAGAVNTSGDTYIYIAIRRPMKTPTSGTSVFYPLAIAQTDTPDTSTVPFPPDLVNTFSRNGTNRTSIYNLFQFVDRLRSLGIPSNTFSGSTEGYSLVSSSTAAESSTGGYVQLRADGINITRSSGWNSASYGNWINYFWRRAPGFFDVVCYSNAGSPTTVAHNLGVEPELIITKRRNGAYDWIVYSKTLGATKVLFLNTTDAQVTFTCFANVGATSFQTFSPANSGTQVAYLFASVTGVSKVGSYTGNGSSQTINCGFAAGARFILIKRTDSTGDWYVWDTARGIVSGNDPRLSLNSTAAEVTTDDSIDPDNSGFIVNQLAATNINVNAATYIYLAIA